MELIKRVKAALTAESIVALCVIGSAWSTGFPLWSVAALVILQVIFAAFVVLKVIFPLCRLEELLEDSIARQQTEEELKNAAGSVPFMEQIYTLIDRYAAIRTRRNSAKVLDKQTELTALQSQINPHFLYNTLESIRGQALLDENMEIARMVEALAAFFRYSISRKGNLVTLREELANIQNYMLIQRYRFNNRFSLEVIIDEEDEAAYDFLIPRLIIQPVVENAIFHGLEELLEGGRVTIEVIVTEQNLIITVSDNGKGIEADMLRKLNSRISSRDTELEEGTGRKSSTRNTGIALPNVHKRIQLLFGEEYGVNVYSTVGQGTDVEITVPANYQRGTDHEERDIAD